MNNRSMLLEVLCDVHICLMIVHTTSNGFLVFIIYYIITVLVVTKSLYGFVSHQVQYNMDIAQYLG